MTKAASRTPCERYEQLREAGDERALTPAERQFLLEHRGCCADCSLMESVEHYVAFDGTAGPCPQLAPESQHLVLQRCSALPPADEPRPWRPRWSLFAALATATAVTVAALLLPRLWQIEGAPPPAPWLRLALVSATAPSTATAGEALVQGSLVTARDGPAAIQAANGISLLLDDAGTVRVAELSAALLRVELESGELAISKEPGAAAKLVVSMSMGDVEITGTQLIVRAGNQPELRVMRGAVRVHERGRVSREVHASLRYVFGEQEARPMSAAELELDSERLAILALLDHETVTRLSIASVPAGAEIRVDGQRVGHTPAAILLRPGSHTLQLARDGYASVREELSLRAGELLTRHFVLASPGASDHDMPPPSLPSSEASRARTSEPRKESPEPRRESPAELLERAQGLRADRDWTAAARAYSLLVERHPASSEAASALVSLAELELDIADRPAAALALYERYLRSAARDSLLAEEATLGKANALHRLRRYADEAQTLRTFVEEFPSALQLDHVRRRLRALEAPTPPLPESAGSPPESDPP